MAGGADEIIDAICLEVAEAFLQGLIGAIESTPANAGQETLVTDLVGQMEGQAENLAQGEANEVNTSHPEAIGMIVDYANAYLQAIAAAIQELRQKLEAIFAMFGGKS